MIIDDCWQDNSRIYVYEILNSNSINEVKKISLIMKRN